MPHKEDLAQSVQTLLSQLVHWIPLGLQFRSSNELISFQSSCPVPRMSNILQQSQSSDGILSDSYNFSWDTFLSLSYWTSLGLKTPTQSPEYVSSPLRLSSTRQFPCNFHISLQFISTISLPSLGSCSDSCSDSNKDLAF